MAISDLSDALKQHHHHHHHYDKMPVQTIYEKPLNNPFIFMNMFSSYPMKTKQPLHWKPFELCSSVTDGVETKLLISPVLDGHMAVPIMSNPEYKEHNISDPFFVNTYDCRNYDETNIDHILRGLTVKLSIWHAAMKSFTWENMSTFSQNDITGTLVLRNTIERSLFLYQPLTELLSKCKHDSNTCITFAVHYMVCKARFDHWIKFWSEFSPKADNSSLWIEAFEEMDELQQTPFEAAIWDLVLCRVGPTW
jgi:hypothetical protein